MPEFTLDCQGVYRSRLLGALAFIEHGFGSAASAGWPDPARLLTLRQVHSGRVVCVGGSAKPGCAGEGDALVTRCPGVLLGVRTADCVPILIADPIRRAVAAVHAGWRGTIAQVVRRTVETLAAEFGSNPSDLLAAIGPSIGPCCYQVGPEVARQFCGIFPERAELEGRAHIDLAEANRRLLVQAGVAEWRIGTGAPCTFCTPGLHSFRRDHSQARMVSAIGLAP